MRNFCPVKNWPKICVLRGKWGRNEKNCVYGTPNRHIFARNDVSWRIDQIIRSKGVMWGSRDPLLEFWHPLISRERLKLETSNLARRRTHWVLTKKCKIRSKWVMRRSRDPLLEFWDPLISREQTSNLARTKQELNILINYSPRNLSRCALHAGLFLQKSA